MLELGGNGLNGAYLALQLLLDFLEFLFKLKSDFFETVLQIFDF